MARSHLRQRICFAPSSHSSGWCDCFVGRTGDVDGNFDSFVWCIEKACQSSWFHTFHFLSFLHPRTSPSTRLHGLHNLRFAFQRKVLALTDAWPLWTAHGSRRVEWMCSLMGFVWRSQRCLLHPPWARADQLWFKVLLVLKILKIYRLRWTFFVSCPFFSFRSGLEGIFPDERLVFSESWIFIVFLIVSYTMFHHDGVVKLHHYFLSIGRWSSDYSHHSHHQDIFMSSSQQPPLPIHSHDLSPGSARGLS